jgi:cytochrome b subunit of formate dehydrogenase
MLAGILVFCVLCWIYLAPSGVAFARHHRQRAPILIVNICLGWTLIGWVICLAWAATSQEPSK